MPDPHYADPRLAAVYDALDADRSDLDAYAAMSDELGARHVVDVGCGTGTFALLLAGRGLEVVGVDPARASLDVARAKPGADAVRWVQADLAGVPPVGADLVTMTGNAAQAVVEDDAWARGLAACAAAVRTGGHVVLETRDPADRAWERWTPERTRVAVDVPGIGRVEHRVELVEVALPFVRFRGTSLFRSDGAELHSDSTLRFRDRDETAADLAAAGLEVREVRDAPDRPGRELVFLARRS